MRYSQTLIPTVKEVPADAEIISHQLMLRAGLMRKLASGTYIYLPAGMRMLQKVMQIIREEMNKSGAQEILIPMVQPMELWQRTGRDVDYGETLGRFTDRHGRENVLSPTAEEGVTYLAACEIKSYKQLPMNLYQINVKYRDEFRPRFGVLRSREFIMKDAYSFHESEECLQKTYQAMYDAYKRIFSRCGLEYVIVQAESGEMGGSGSHQFTVPCDNGEDVIVYTADDELAWNIEKAPVDALPKEPVAADVGPVVEIHTPNVGTIDAVCGFLKTTPDKMIKTLLYENHSIKEDLKEFSAHDATHKDGMSATPPNPHWSKRFAVVVRGDYDVNHEKLTQLTPGEHLELLSPEDIMRYTGAAVGFAGPIDLLERNLVHELIIDHSVAAMAFGVAGANKTDYHVTHVVPGRDFPLTGENVRVVDIRNAVDGDTYAGKKLLFKRGIEVGQVFKLGIKYSAKLDANFLNADGVEKPALMGCYGIGVNRIVASAIENGYDENGMILPISIAPWEVIITPAAPDEPVVNAAEALYDELSGKGVEVLLDDRDMRAGVKFKDADLLGIPVRVTVGKKSLAEGNVELKLRTEKEAKLIPMADAANAVGELVSKMKAALNSAV